MNTPVSFEISKLLKEKGFDSYCDKKYIAQCLWQKPNSRENYKNSDIHKNSSDVSAPTITEVVMWLYEKHRIWTVVNVNIMGSWYFEHFDLKEKRNAQFKPTDTQYDSPTEAYSQAIEYTLNNLI